MPTPLRLQGLRFLFAHLALLVGEGEPSPWRGLKMVHAKAQLARTNDEFKDQLWDLFTEYLYEEQEGLEGFNFDANAPDAPHNPIPIPLDNAYADWEPTREPSALVEAYTSRTFGDLIQFVEASCRRGDEP